MKGLRRNNKSSADGAKDGQGQAKSNVLSSFFTKARSSNKNQADPSSSAFSNGRRPSNPSLLTPYSNDLASNRYSRSVDDLTRAVAIQMDRDTSSRTGAFDENYIKRNKSASHMDSQDTLTHSGADQSSLPSSGIVKEGWLAKRNDRKMMPSLEWRVYRVMLKGSKLYFYKSPNEQAVHNVFFNRNTSSIAQVSTSTILSGDRGMPLVPAAFETSAYSLIFEDAAQSVAPLAARYLYGETFVEVDNASNMHFKNYSCILIFADVVLVCRRKLQKNTSDRFKSVVRFTQGNAEDAVSISDSLSISSNRTRDTNALEFEKGTFTKWKIETVHQIHQVDVVDDARLRGGSNKASNQSVLHLFFSSTDEVSHRFFLPASEPEVNTIFAAKLSAAKDEAMRRQMRLRRLTHETLQTAQGERVDTTGQYLRRESAQSLLETHQEAVTERKVRAFWGTSSHPDLVIRPSAGAVLGMRAVCGGTLDALVHELVFGTMAHGDYKAYLAAFLLTYLEFAKVDDVVRELIRCAEILFKEDPVTAESRLKTIVHTWCSEYAFDTAEDNVPSKLEPIIHSIFVEKEDEATAFRQTLITNNTSTPRLDQVDTEPSRDPPELANLLITGLTPALLLRLRPDVISQQLQHFHLRRYKEWHISTRAFLDHATIQDASTLRLFLFTHQTPHFVTVLVMHHVLIACQHPAMAGRRSLVLQQWIYIAKESYRIGDMCSWMAIVLALCSPPIVRLKESWRGILDKSAVDLVIEKWAPFIVAMHKFDFDLNLRKVPAASVIHNTQVSSIPYFGNIKLAVQLIRNTDTSQLTDHAVSISKSQIDFQKSWMTLEVVTMALKNWQMAVRSQKNLAPLSSRGPPVRALQKYFEHLADISPSSSVESNDLFGASLASEPHHFGAFLRARNGSDVISISPNAYIPLLFTEIIQSSTFFDRSIQAHKIQNSDSAGNMAQPARSSQNTHRRSVSSPAAAAEYPNSSGISSDRRQSRSMHSGLGEMVVSVHNGELVLKAAATASGSRRTSTIEGYSIPLPSALGDKENFLRLLPHLNRNSYSYSNRSSTSTVGKRASIKSLENTTSPSQLSCFPKAGTMQRLVDVLVLGVVDFVKDVVDADGQPALVGGKQFVINTDEYLAVFFASYRSFATPMALLDDLRRRFINARMDAASQDPVDWRTIGRVQSGVLVSLEFWIVEHFYDFLDDLNLQRLITQTLGAADNEVSQCWNVAFKESGIVDAVLSECGQQLATSIQGLKQILAERCYQPYCETDSSATKSYISILKQAPSELPVLPSVETYQYDRVLHHLNGISNAVFQIITPEDYMLTFELLETQCTSPLGWYIHRSSSFATEEEMLISDIFIAFDQVRVAGDVDDLRFKDILPKSIQTLCNLHTSIKLWAISEIASAKIDMPRRVNRIQSFLSMIVHSRKLMERFELYGSANGLIDKNNQGGGEGKAVVPSFVESAIVAALVSPEARSYIRAWLEVAAERGTTLESLASLLRSPTGSLVAQQNQLTAQRDSDTGITLVPSLGWLFERMLELACFVPDGIMSDTGSPQRLVHFDKQRNVFDLVQSYLHTQGDLIRLEARGGSFEMLLTHCDQISTGLDWRLVKDAAAREAIVSRMSNEAALIASHMGKTPRVFYRLIQQEQDKLARETDALNRTTAPRVEPVASRIQHKKSRSQKFSKMNSLFKGRPASVSGLSISNSTEAFPAELAQFAKAHSSDYGPLSNTVAHAKPTIVINLTNSTVSLEDATASTKGGPNAPMAAQIFKLITEEGATYVLQAIDEDDSQAWMASIGTAAKESLRRRTLLAQDMPPPVANVAPEPVLAPTQANSRGSVYGVDLQTLVDRERTSVPLIVERCLSEIEARGLEEVGIYRLAGSSGSIAALRAAFNKNAAKVNLKDDAWADINVVADAIKQWFRALPEPLLTYHLYNDFVQSMAIEEYDDRLYRLKDLVHELPKANFDILKRLIEHLEKVTDFEDVNHMYAHNLAIVFGPTLLKAPPGPASFAASMGNLGHAQNVVKNLILQYHWIWDLDNEQENEQQGAAAMGDTVTNSQMPQALDHASEHAEEKHDINGNGQMYQAQTDSHDDDVVEELNESSRQSRMQEKDIGEDIPRPQTGASAADETSTDDESEEINWEDALDRLDGRESVVT